ncbi:MAG: M20/M25/M40 family metallo-hydrolase [Gemmatimonadota bacterium]|nr:M20/M25/M40 family metallo-hydrolase [Gemmatimonadota bacterium]
MRRFAVAAILLVSSTPLRAQASNPGSLVDWTALQGESVRHLQEYVRVNTSNPPGNEIEGARFLKAILEREGIEAMILDTTELGPGHANLYARLKGNGSRKAIALVHHIDVVPAVPAYWTSDPFGGEIKDGFIYGRGTLDMKGQGIAHLMAMIALKRSGAPLTRDIVFIANTNEENGATGAAAFVMYHADLLRDVEYLFTEGGDNPVVNGATRYYGVGVEEKRPFGLKLVAHGVPSHGSRPTKVNPVVHLVAALDRIARYETPLHVVPGVARYFAALSRGYSGQKKAWMSDVAAAIKVPAARAWLTSDVYWNAILRNTLSLTVVTGSNKNNVIPPEASAYVDIRLLPDQDPQAFLADIRRIVADTSIEITPPATQKARMDNPIDTDLFRAVERATHDREPNALVTTPMFTAASDRPYYRALGIITYGFDPFRVPSVDMQKGMHGNDERISVENMGFGVRYLFDVLRYAQ